MTEGQGQLFDIYCDESCHLERDGMPNLVLGAVCLPHHLTAEVNAAIRGLKSEFGYNPDWEVKWSRVSPSRLPFYQALVAYFLEHDNLTFRGWVAPKGGLRHLAFDQTHDDWYYKMYYLMLQPLLHAGAHYRIYLDIKDTRGGEKAAKLREVLSNSIHDFDQEVVERIQIIQSDEVQVLQLADLLIGAIGYANRGLQTNSAKVSLIRQIQQGAGVRFTRNTRRDDRKVNLFHWKQQDEP